MPQMIPYLKEKKKKKHKIGKVKIWAVLIQGNQYYLIISYLASQPFSNVSILSSFKEFICCNQSK